MNELRTWRDHAVYHVYQSTAGDWEAMILLPMSQTPIIFSGGDTMASTVEMVEKTYGERAEQWHNKDIFLKEVERRTLEETEYPARPFFGVKPRYKRHIPMGIMPEGSLKRNDELPYIQDPYVSEVEMQKRLEASLDAKKLAHFFRSVCLYPEGYKPVPKKRAIVPYEQDDGSTYER